MRFGTFILARFKAAEEGKHDNFPGNEDCVDNHRCADYVNYSILPQTRRRWNPFVLSARFGRARRWTRTIRRDRPVTHL